MLWSFLPSCAVHYLLWSSLLLSGSSLGLFQADSRCFYTFPRAAVTKYCQCKPRERHSLTVLNVRSLMSWDQRGRILPCIFQLLRLLAPRAPSPLALAYSCIPPVSASTVTLPPPWVPLWHHTAFFFFLFRATPATYGSSQARGRIGAASDTYATATGSARSKLHLWPTPQLAATPDP